MNRGRYLILAGVAAAFACKTMPASPHKFPSHAGLTEPAQQASPVNWCRGKTTNNFAYCNTHWILVADGNTAQVHASTQEQENSRDWGVHNITYQLPSGEVGMPILAQGTRKTLYFLTDKGWLYALSRREWSLRAERIFTPRTPANVGLVPCSTENPYDIVIVAGSQHIAARYNGQGNFNFSQ